MGATDRRGEAQSGPSPWSTSGILGSAPIRSCSSPSFTLELTNRTHSARKALSENLIREIHVIADDTVRPVFKLPIGRNGEGPAPMG